MIAVLFANGGDLIATIGAVIVAAISATGAVIVARNTSATKRAAEATQTHVGTTNGQGTLADMMARTLTGLGELTHRVIAHEENDVIRFDELSKRVDSIATTTDDTNDMAHAAEDAS